MANPLFWGPACSRKQLPGSEKHQPCEVSKCRICRDTLLIVIREKLIALKASLFYSKALKPNPSIEEFLWKLPLEAKERSDMMPSSFAKLAKRSLYGEAVVSRNPRIRRDQFGLRCQHGKPISACLVLAASSTRYLRGQSTQRAHAQREVA